MTIKLPDELRQAIDDGEGGPIEIEDDRTQRVYVLVAREELHRLIDDRLRRELQIGFDQADAGDEDDWDVNEILEEAHRRRAERTQS